MAGRKRTINRKEQRGEYEEENAEKAEAEDTEEDDDEAPKKKTKPVKVKKPAAPKRRRSTKKVVRQRAVWVVYDNSTKQIDTFPYSERAAAEKPHAEES